MLSRWTHPSFFFILLIIQSSDFSLSADNATKDIQEVTLAAILPLTNTEYAWAWPRVAPALHQAVRRVNSDSSLLPGLKLRLVHGSSENREGFCSDSMAPLVAVDLKMSHDPWAFIGPGCDYSSSPVARFTTHWEVPMVTAGARAIGFESYKAVTNTGPTHKKLGELGARIQETFGWRQRAMLIFSDNKDANDDRPCYFAVEGLYTVLGKQNITIQDHVIDGDTVNYKSVVQDIRESGRVIYLCCPWDILRNLMVQFWKEGVDLDEYVFFFIDLFAEGVRGQGPVKPWYRGDQDDHTARHAFRSVKVLTYLEPKNPEYVQFVETLKDDAKKMFNFTIEDSLFNLIAGGFHDGVMIYSHALNETLSEQRGPGEVQRPRGDMVTKRMWNRKFQGVMGMVEMDEIGDREVDFAIWDMTDVSSGEFQVVSVYNSSTKQLVMQSGRSFQWPGGSPPPDIPECGFKNDKPECLTRTVSMHQMVAIVMCFVFVIIVTVTVFIYREITARPRMKDEWMDV